MALIWHRQKPWDVAALNHVESEMSRGRWVDQALECQESSWAHRERLCPPGGAPLGFGRLAAYAVCSRAPSSRECTCIPRRRRCRRPRCGSCTCGCSSGPSGQVDKLKAEQAWRTLWDPRPARQRRFQQPFPTPSTHTAPCTWEVSSVHQHWGSTLLHT